MSAHRGFGHRGFRLGAALAALLALSACSSVSGGGGPFAGIFGGAGSDVEPAVASSLEELAGPGDAGCPRPEVIRGDAAERVYRGGRSGSNQDLRYQIGLVEIARECALTPDGQNVIKVGVRGRVLIGPAGGPGTFTAPIRIVARSPSTVFENRSRRVSVTIPPGQTQGEFTLVEENLRVPAALGDAFFIQVGVAD